MGVICQYAEGDFVKGDKDVIISEIVIDSREVSSDSLFIPIIGERFDGHQFLEGAYDNGCRSFIIDKNHDFVKDDINLIRVDDTTKVFGLISKAISDATSDDVLVLMGKGDENYQIIGNEFVPYETDMVIVSRELSKVKEW